MVSRKFYIQTNANVASVFIQVGRVGGGGKQNTERTFLRMSDRNHYELLDESEIEEGDAVLVIEETK
jgi:hypothetical protein